MDTKSVSFVIKTDAGDDEIAEAVLHAIGQLSAQLLDRGHRVSGEDLTLTQWSTVILPLDDARWFEKWPTVTRFVKETGEAHRLELQEAKDKAGDIRRAHRSALDDLRSAKENEEALKTWVEDERREAARLRAKVASLKAEMQEERDALRDRLADASDILVDLLKGDLNKANA